MPEGSSKGRGFSPATIFLLILATFGVGAPLVLSGPRAASSTATPAAKRAAATSDKSSAEALLDQFFDADPNQLIDQSQPWQRNALIYPAPNHGWNPGDPRTGDRISFLIATLPNPENPSLRYEFDRFIDSIQRAFSHEYYLLDKISLTTKPDSAGAANATAPERLRRPGMMLFRRADSAGADHPARDSLVVVFVVGETPTDGVDAAALRSALDQIAWLRGWTGPGTTPAPPHLVELTRNTPDDQTAIDNQITIIGPTYSGSITSIEEVLRSWLNVGKFAQPPRQVSLLSGTATAIYRWPRELGEFHSTERPENETYDRIVHYFKHDLNDPSLAILTDDTGYGSSIGKLYEHFHKLDHNSKLITVLPYPIHISNVRTALANSPQSATPAATPLGWAHRDPTIPDEDPGQDRYLVPSFSHASAADDEVVLADLLATIHQENFHYVGVVATNIQDAIFLIREIRDNCPDTIPFLTSADLLYLHSDFNRDLAGTLIFSTYPLFASNQLWTWPSTFDYRRFQFPSGEAEGIYNAVLAALEDDPKLMVEYTLPFSDASAGPPLWVSVVGKHALWPVTIYPSDKNHPSTQIVPRPPPKSTDPLPIDFGMTLYPRLFVVSFALVIIPCALPHLFLIKSRMKTGARMSRLAQFIGRITPSPPRRLARLLDDSAIVNRLDRRLSLLSMICVLLSFFLLATAVWLLPLRAMGLWTPSDISLLRDNLWLLVWTLVPTLLVGGLILLSLGGLILDTVRQSRSHDQASWTVKLRLIASVISVFLTFGFAFMIYRQQPLQAVLYFVRASNLWNGVSPLLPLLYIGFAALWLSASELWRLSLSEEYVLAPNFLGFGDEGSFAGIGAHERATVRLLKGSTNQIPFWGLCMVLPFVIFFLLHMPGLELVAIDGRFFNLFFISVAIFVYTSLLLLIARFIAIWFELHPLLRQLYMHPTRRAYEELRTTIVPPSMADRQHIWLVEPSSSVAAIEFCLERVREMLRLVDPPKDATPTTTITGRVIAARVALVDLVAATQPALDQVLRCEAASDCEDTFKWKSWLQSAMSDLSRQVTVIFEPWWRLDRQLHLSVKPTPEQSALDESLVKNAELFVASRVVDFLRQVFPQMMNLVVSASVGLLALILAASSYPFPQRDTISWLSWIILLSVIGVTIAILVQINRDRIVSMLSGTTPGELNWNSGFVWHLVIFGLVPILTLLGAQFPSALQGLFSSFGGLFGGAH
jgi:hypothetical protein